ncbi:subtilisin-like protein [Lentinula edodes]|uniref:subtilisin-like protein n=1 Tax=Lentinula edodes TaxID=5353 RepID=UPI001E8D8069|nr:subtilisin-like protein [Lentinula edodes]KAH7872402.1 subtilisin-like protein [Lentinula edodes]
MHLPLAFLTLGLAATLAPSSISAPSSTITNSSTGSVPHVVHEKRAADPLDWFLSHKPSPSKILPLRIGLTQQNIDKISDLLMAVSHPDSSDYGKHWTPQQVVDTFKPKAESVDSVVGWLRDFGFEREKIRTSANKGWVEVMASVEEVERLLGTEYHVYKHVETGEEQISCETYSVPADIRKHIDLIKPTVHFNHRPSPKTTTKFKRAASGANLGKPGVSTVGPKKSPDATPVPPSLENCDKMITLDCLKALYDVPDFNPVSTDTNSYGILEFTPQAFLAGDLDLFFSNFSPSLVGVRPKTVLIDGGTVVQTTNQSFDFNGESDLDLEYGMSLVNPQTVTLLQTGDLVEGAGFDNWLDAVDGSFCTFEGGDDPTQDGIYPDPLPGGFKGPESCGILAPPFVVSTSYGQDESTITAFSATRQCNEYGKLGLMGTTILYSSGDNGVAGNGGVCLNSQGQPVANGSMFNPDFPATCPFVTAAGATQVNPGSTVFDPEGACEQVIFSGGGFSNIFAIPDYQQTAVSSFLTNHPPPYTSAQFNNSGTSRAFPDLAANGANYVIGIDGEFELVFGTSCSSPVVGSFITMVNDARLAAGKGPVGFINPAIYSDQFQDAFNDITMGTNQGCNTVGFTATDGWDPVTGVGTPNVTKLIPLFLSLP